jgi:hypothetical protein
MEAWYCSESSEREEWFVPWEVQESGVIERRVPDSQCSILFREMARVAHM